MTNPSKKKMNTLKNIVETTLVPHTAFEDAIQRVEQCFQYSDGASEPICLALIGESRTGKSRALEEAESRHPRNRTKEGLDVPVLRVKTPSKPTVKGLAEVMLRAIGDPKWASSGTENTKTTRLQTLIENTGTKMVMIDEFQHFYDKGLHKVMHHVADWLKILVDDSKVALVVAGLPSCTAVLDQNEQLAGRFLSPVFIPRFNWLHDDQRGEFVAILSAFQESLGAHFDLPELDSDEMAFRFFCATGGLIGYLTKTLRQTVWDALDKKRRVITLEDLRLAHKKAVWEKSGMEDVTSPFARAFSTNPTQDILARVQLIGVRLEENFERSARKPRKKNAFKMPVSEALCAS